MISARTYDCVVLGGGIVGLATAYHLLESGKCKSVIVLEKEADLARHQTGRNSGVIHSGIYYKPGSFKARLCRQGREKLIAYCQRHDIPHDICGKIILATSAAELPRLKNIEARAKANGVKADWLDRQGIQKIEPSATGIAALHVHDAGIVDFAQVTRQLASDYQARGGVLRMNTRVSDIFSSNDKVVVEAEDFQCQTGMAVNCTGLFCDRIFRRQLKHQTQKNVCQRTLQIVPFRGEYYQLTPDAADLVKHLIYPVPDPRFPFLGVHFTRMIAGGVEAGPNAVLAYAREGYRKMDVNLFDLFESLSYPGFQMMASQYFWQGVDEILRSLSRKRFAQALARMVPDISEQDLVNPTSGIRAQALRPDGRLVDDFHFEYQERVLHVLNAPSPAATSSLAIGEAIAQRLNSHS